MTHDDSSKADDGKTAMQRYADFHTRNCNCIPVAHDDAAQDNTHTEFAETRRDNQEKT